MASVVPAQPLAKTSGPWAIERFHESGAWVAYPAYRHERDLTETLKLAQKWAEEPEYGPLGIRVVDRYGWTSEVFGGRPCFQIAYNPFAEQWWARCATTGETAIGDGYAVCRFGREHKCAEPAHSIRTTIPGGFSHADFVPLAEA